MILTEKDARDLLKKIIKYSKADSVSLTLSGSNIYNLRYALNSISTNGYSDNLTLDITSDFGKRSGSSSTNKFEEKDLKEALEVSEKIAILSPERTEYVPLLQPQVYQKPINYSADTEKLSPETRAEKLEYIIKESEEKDILSTGYLEDSTSFIAILNSNGLFAYNKRTNANYSNTTRTKDNTGSSRVEKNNINFNKISFNELADIVIKKSILSRNPKELKPGKYTVILEPAACADIASRCLNFMNARQADEGRSFFSKKDGGNKINEKLVSEVVNIYSDPADINAPSNTFSGEGLPINKTDWFKNGVLMNLYKERYWAEKTNTQAIPYPSNIIFSGFDKKLDEIISNTEYCLLVTRFWYIRTVEYKSMLLTGLTRDGLFEVKDGKITGSVKNFRFNESPIDVLKNIIEIGQSENAVGSENSGMKMFVPPIKVNNFNFSSLSDAI